MFHHPIIDQGIARACVEGKQITIRSNESNIGYTANVYESAGANWCKCGMIDRHKRSTLPASRHISGAHVIDDGNARGLGQRLTIAKLHREARFWLVQDSLAVKSNYIYF